MSTTEPDLRPFCLSNLAKLKIRPYLGKPFSIGDFTYATNGYILVRVPVRKAYGPPDSPVGVETVYAKLLAEISYFPAPAIDGPLFVMRDTPCPNCQGRGTLHDCPNCSCRCQECAGAGKELDYAVVRLPWAVFDAKYISKIWQLPNPCIAACREKGPMPFRFDGGDGLIMPMRYYDGRRVIDVAVPEYQP